MFDNNRLSAKNGPDVQSTPGQAQTAQTVTGTHPATGGVVRWMPVADPYGGVHGFVPTYHPFVPALANMPMFPLTARTVRMAPGQPAFGMRPDANRHFRSGRSGQSVTSQPVESTPLSRKLEAIHFIEQHAGRLASGAIPAFPLSELYPQDDHSQATLRRIANASGSDAPPNIPLDPNDVRMFAEGLSSENMTANEAVNSSVNYVKQQAVRFLDRLKQETVQSAERSVDEIASGDNPACPLSELYPQDDGSRMALALIGDVAGIDTPPKISLDREELRTFAEGLLNEESLSANERTQRCVDHVKQQAARFLDELKIVARAAQRMPPQLAKENTLCFVEIARQAPLLLKGAQGKRHREKIIEQAFVDLLARHVDTEALIKLLKDID